ncbi:hypothetical protein Anapl_17003 [Anas platyrhynchos]|uniref:Uncharacterized protein n=1 Tax=Anas platyrhynchos TaxID=8839 RepID=R0JB68_ANAPL|nr:hypothetical protein Anapl_17003 [Anas platyrhynchos]
MALSAVLSTQPASPSDLCRTGDTNNLDTFNLTIKIHQAAIKEDTSRKHTSRDPSLERIIFNHLFVPRNQ